MSQLATRPSVLTGVEQAATFQPFNAQTIGQQLDAERIAKGKERGVLDKALGISQNEWLYSWWRRKEQQAKFIHNPDSNFVLDKPTIDKLTDGLGQEYWEAFDASVSYDHAMLIRDQMMEHQASTRDVGIGLRMLVGSADPVQSIPSLLTGGIASAATKGGTLARLAKAGIYAMAENLPAAAYTESQDPTYTFGSFLQEETAAMTLGALGAGAEMASPAVSAAVGRVFRRVRPERTPIDASPAVQKALYDLHKDGEFETLTKQEPASTGATVEAPAASPSAFDVAIGRLAGLDPNKKLNREEVDEILKGTGYRTANQGWPTVEDMHGYIEGMAERARGMVPEQTPSADIGITRTIAASPPPSTVDRGVGAAGQGGPEFRPDNPTGEVGDVVLTDKGRARYQEQSSPDGAARAVDRWLTTFDADPNNPADAAIVARAKADPVAFLRDGRRLFDRMAMVGPITPETIKLETILADLGSVSDAKSERGMISMAGQIGETDIPAARAVARMLAEDATSFTADSASTFVRRSIDGTMIPALRLSDQEYKGWAKDNGLNLWQRMKPENRAKFSQEVGIEMTTPGAQGYQRHPAVVKTAAAYRKAIEDAAMLAKMAKVPGFEDLSLLKNYLPRLYKHMEMVKGSALWGGLDDFTPVDADGFRHFIRFDGKNKFAALWARSILSHDPSFDPAKVIKVADGLVKIQIDRTRYSDADMMKMLSGDEGDLLVNAMRDNGVDEDAIRGVLMDVQVDPDGKKPPRTRHRIPIDESYREMTAEGEFAVQNFIDRDADRLTFGYVRGTLGRTGLSMVLQESSRRFGLEAKTWAQLKQLVIDDGNRLGQSKQLPDITDKLDTLHDLLLGIPLPGNKAYAEVARGLMHTNHAMLMGGMGITQFTEIYRSLGDLGFRAVLQAIPATNTIFRAAKDGLLDNRTISELQGIVGMGGDSVMRRVFGHLNPELMGIGEARASGWSNTMRTIAGVSSTISGFHIADDWTKTLTMNATAQYIINAAMSGKMLKAKRLEMLGLTPAEWTRMTAQIKANKQDIVLPTGKLRGFGFEKWTDPPMAHKLVVAIQRHAERLIQVNDIGNYSQWMTTTTGRVISQFRVFPMVAYEKQFRNGVYQATGPGGDPAATITAFGVATLGAGITYTLRMYALSLGRDDAEEFRAQNLSPGAIAANAVARAGWANMMPQAYDLAAKFAGLPMVFSPEKADVTNPLDNPSISLLTQRLPAATRAAGQVAGNMMGFGDQTVTQNEARALARMAVFQNVMGLKNALDYFVTRQPER